jgi:WD40 repeat protein
MRLSITGENVASISQLSQIQCGWITQVCWSPSGNMLAIAHAMGIRLYVGGFGGAPDHVLEGHHGHVKGVAFSPDGKTLVSVGADTEVRLWSVEGAVGAGTIFKGHTDSVEAVVFSPNGTSIASAGGDRSVRLWDTSGNVQAVFDGHQAEITSLAFALNGAMLVSGSRDKTIRVWDVPSETSGTVLGEHEDWVREVAVNPPGTMIASAGKDMNVSLWDAYAEERYAVIRGHEQGVDTVAFSPDGRLLATGGRDNLIRLWSIDHALEKRNLQESDALVTLSGHDKPVLTLAFNADGTFLASGSGDNTVRLWGILS